MLGRSLLAVLAAVLAASCASYPQRAAAALDAFQRGHFEDASAEFGETTDSDFLAGAEAGTVALAAGDWEGALRHLQRAGEAVKDIEDRALVSASSLSESVASWALNDTAKPYRGEGFERVYVHCGLAMAYLALGRTDSVFVEVRRANMLLEREEELYEAEYASGGLGHFISAVTYELRGQPDDAYIVDYRRMVDKGVGTELAGRALVRLAHVLRRDDDDAARWEQRFGPDIARPDGAASIVVIAGVGLAPVKEEGKIFVPTKDGVIPFAVPIYRRRPQQVAGATLRLGTGEGVRTDVLEDVSTIAVENLEDRVAWMAAKSVARGVLKRELTKKLEGEFDLAGRIAGDVFALVSERADLRSWLTLPDTWQGSADVRPVRDALALAGGGRRRIRAARDLQPRARGDDVRLRARARRAHLRPRDRRSPRPGAADHPGRRSGRPYSRRSRDAMMTPLARPTRRRTTMRSLIQALTLAPATLLLWGAGCTAPSGGPTNTYTGGPGQLTQEQIASQALQRDVEILVRNSVRRDGFLICQFDLHNKRSSDIQLEWSVDWFDRDGMQLQVQERWSPLKISGGGYETVQITGPTPSAERWRLAVRRPNPVR